MSKLTTTSLRLTDLDLCHPKFAGPAHELAKYLVRAYETGLTQTRFECFESLRLAGRQNYLFRKGSSKAIAWQSAHNFGLAADFVPNERRIRARLETHIMRGWSWADDADWKFLAESAEKFGLAVPIAWDLSHVQSPLWKGDPYD